MRIDKVRTKIHKNSTTIKTTNRRFTIVKPVHRETLVMPETENVIIIDAMTADVTENPGCSHELRGNGKIKTTMLGLSDIALKELYYTLHVHFGQHREMYGE